MKPLLSRQSGFQGSALALTFWLIAIMGLVVIGAIQFAVVDTRTVTAQRGLAQARRMAERALAVGAHPEVQRGDPLLKSRGDEGAYQAWVTMDEGRINPNALISSKQGIVLNRLFLLWGMEPALAIALTGAMTDWVDGDDFVALNGAEAKEYAAAGRPGLPLNRPFQSFEEMRLVTGMDQLESLRPDWRDFFTLWSEGLIDLNEASPEVMAAATGVRLQAARRVFQGLAGRDGLRFTDDDVRFATVIEALQRLGINTQPPPHLGIDGNTRRVEAIGTAGSFQCKLVMVLNGTEPLHRQELPMNTELNVDPK
jgi:type II secretory pathway component PulK